MKNAELVKVITASNGKKILAVIKYQDDDYDWCYVLYPIVGKVGCDHRCMINKPILTRKLCTSHVDEALADRIKSVEVYYNDSITTYALFWNGTFIGTIKDQGKGTKFPRKAATVITAYKDCEECNYSVVDDLDDPNPGIDGAFMLSHDRGEWTESVTYKMV